MLEITRPNGDLPFPLSFLLSQLSSPISSLDRTDNPVTLEMRQAAVRGASPTGGTSRPSNRSPMPSLEGRRETIFATRSFGRRERRTGYAEPGHPVGATRENVCACDFPESSPSPSLPPSRPLVEPRRRPESLGGEAGFVDLFMRGTSCAICRGRER